MSVAFSGLVNPSGSWEQETSTSDICGFLDNVICHHIRENLKRKSTKGCSNDLLTQYWSDKVADLLKQD